MVRGFGVLLVAGIAIAFFLALSAGTAALAATARRRGERRARWRARRAARPSWSTSWRRAPGARWRPLRRVGGRVREAMLRGALERPRRVLLIGLVIALAGLAVDSQTQGQLRPARARAAGPARRARPRRAAARDRRGGGDRRRRRGRGPHRPEGRRRGCATTRPGCSSSYGYSAKNGCGKAELCPALSLPDLFRSEDGDQGPGARSARCSTRCRAYFSQAVITADRKTATLAFGVRLMPLDEQKEVIDEMAARLDPPAGVTARLAGPAGARRGGQRRAVLAAAAARHAAGRAARGRAGAAARVPALGARVGAARADRAGDAAGRRSCCSRCACR